LVQYLEPQTATLRQVADDNLLMTQVMCAVVLLLPRTSRLSPRVRRSIVRAIAIIGDATILTLDVVPLTFGLLTVVRREPSPQPITE